MYIKYNWKIKILKWKKILPYRNTLETMSCQRLLAIMQILWPHSQAIISSFLVFRCGHYYWVLACGMGAEIMDVTHRPGQQKPFTDDGVPQLPFFAVQNVNDPANDLENLLPTPHSIEDGSGNAKRWKTLSHCWRKNHLTLYIFIRLWCK